LPGRRRETCIGSFSNQHSRNSSPLYNTVSRLRAERQSKLRRGERERERARARSRGRERLSSLGTITPLQEAEYSFPASFGDFSLCAQHRPGQEWRGPHVRRAPPPARRVLGPGSREGGQSFSCRGDRTPPPHVVGYLPRANWGAWAEPHPACSQARTLSHGAPPAQPGWDLAPHSSEALRGT